MVKQKDDDREEINLEDRFNLVKASKKIENYKNRRCFPVQPFSLALAIGKVDPQTGLPGLPQGSIIELAGANSKGKTLIMEHAVKAVLDDDPRNKALILFFEPPNLDRLTGIGVDLDRVYILDYSKSEEGFELEHGEQGLNVLLEVAKTDPWIKITPIDSIGGMQVKKEVTDDKGEFIGVDKTPQMAIRATILTRFINQWNTLDPNTRPILFLINHMKDQIEAGGFGLDPLKVNRIGENLNYVTPGGAAIKYACDLRIKIDGRKIEVKEGGRPVKHPIFDHNIQTGIEIHLEVYKNKFCNNQGSRRAIGKFDFTTKSFDLVDEVLSYASYLGIGNISRGAGGFIDGIIPGKKARMSDVQQYFLDNPKALDDLVKEIAPRSNELFGLKEKKKPGVDL